MKNKLVILGLIVLLGGGIYLTLVEKNLSEAKKINNLSSDISTNTQEVQRINTKILEVGDVAPEFNITTVDGKSLTLQDFENKILVVTSSAAWCSTCIVENKNFNPVYDELHDDGLEIITVDIDRFDTVEVIKEFQKRYAPWHNVHVDGSEKMRKDYRFWRFEITYIVKDGIIRFSDLGITSEDTLREEVTKLL